MSKELIQAANNLLSDCDCKGHDVRLLCGYILDTVRADDDEPLSVEWFAGLTGAAEKPNNYLAISVLSNYRLSLMQEDDQVFLLTIAMYDSDRDLNNLCGAFISTRGQLRTLCRVFGVALPEGGAA